MRVLLLNFSVAEDEYPLSIRSYALECYCSFRAHLLIKLASLFKVPPSKDQN